MTDPWQGAYPAIAPSVLAIEFDPMVEEEMIVKDENGIKRNEKR